MTIAPAQAWIQYAAAYRLNHERLRNTGSPPSRRLRGDDK